LFLSECRTSSPPVFVLIYAAESLYSLDEGIKYIPPPSSNQRLRLALGIAKSIAALHLAGIVHGGINTENIYLRYPPGVHAGGSVSNMNIGEVMPTLAGFDVARDFAGDSSKLDVEDPELRVYLHPERMAWGSGKEMQHPRYDVFSLGMAMIEIGLWQRFKSFQKYHEADTDEERKRFSMRLRGHFEGNGNDGRMEGRYRAVVSYCLGRRAHPVDVDGGSEMDNLHGATVSPLGTPNAVRVVQALANILGERDT
jgi:serine/threonine protein kinase